MEDPDFNAVYFDESIHDTHDFILGAFVFAQEEEVNATVDAALDVASLRPRVDEFKSRLPLADNPALRAVRAELTHFIPRRTKVGLVIAPRVERSNIGIHALRGLEAITWKNCLENRELVIHFDQGIFRSRLAGAAQASAIGLPDTFRFEYDSDSRLVPGLQLADLVANAASRILIETLTGNYKTVAVAEGSGFAEGTETTLSYDQLTMLRYSFFSGRPDTPLRDSNGKVQWHLPVVDMRSYAIFTADGLGAAICDAVDAIFGRLWLGCIH